MAAPTPSARVTPPSDKWPDGYQTLIVFSADPDIMLWEKTVKPPGIDGGEAIDITTMHNTQWRTFAARVLKTLTESTMTVGYRGGSYGQVRALVNVETTITVVFPNGSSLAFYGYLRTFESAEHTEGEMPLASCNIQPTMRDPSTGAEESFVYTSATGTGT